MKKKLLALMLSLIMCISVIPLPAHAVVEYQITAGDNVRISIYAAPPDGGREWSLDPGQSASLTAGIKMGVFGSVPLGSVFMGYKSDPVGVSLSATNPSQVTEFWMPSQSFTLNLDARPLNVSITEDYIMSWDELASLGACTPQIMQGSDAVTTPVPTLANGRYSLDLEQAILDWCSANDRSPMTHYTVYFDYAGVSGDKNAKYNFEYQGNRLDTPNPQWNGTQVRWDAVENAGSYSYTIEKHLSNQDVVVHSGTTTDTFVECLTQEISLVNGVNYLVRVTARPAEGTVGKLNSNPGTSAPLTWSAHKAPVFTLQPVSQQVVEGQPCTLTVAVTGSPAPKLQWYKSGTGSTLYPIEGATGTSYTVTSVDAVQGGEKFQCRAVNTNRGFNSEDAVLSNVAVLTSVPDIQQATLHFDPNGGTGTMTDITGNAADLVLPECTFTPPAEKEFYRWKLVTPDRNLLLQPGTHYAFDRFWAEELTVLAHWKDYLPNSVTPATAKFDPNEGDMVFTLNSESEPASRPVGVSVGGQPLTKGTDYKINGSQVVLCKSYLLQQSGELQVTFDMDTHNDPVATLTVPDYHKVSFTVTPEGTGSVLAHLGGDPVQVDDVTLYVKDGDELSLTAQAKSGWCLSYVRDLNVPLDSADGKQAYVNNLVPDFSVLPTADMSLEVNFVQDSLGLSAAPSVLDFGIIKEGGPLPAAKGIILQNTGSRPLNLVAPVCDSFTVSGGTGGPMLPQRYMTLPGYMTEEEAQALLSRQTLSFQPKAGLPTDVYITEGLLLEATSGTNDKTTARVVLKVRVVSADTSIVTVKADPANGGSVSGGGAVSPGEQTTVEAVPGPGFYFAGWTDENGRSVSASESYTFTPAGDIALTAKFEPIVNRVSPSAATFDPTDYEGTISFTLDAPHDTLNRVLCGQTVLVKGTDYTVNENGDVLSLSREWLLAKAPGDNTLTFDMDKGPDPTATLTIPRYWTVELKIAPDTVRAFFCDENGFDSFADGMKYYVPDGQEATLSCIGQFPYRATSFELDGEAIATEGACSFTPNSDCTLTANMESGLKLALNTGELDFGTETVDYGKLTPKKFTVTNTGEVGLRFYPSFGKYFLIILPEEPVLMPGDSATLKAVPKPGLPAGDYNETISIGGGAYLEPMVLALPEDRPETELPDYDVEIGLKLSFTVEEHKHHHDAPAPTPTPAVVTAPPASPNTGDSTHLGLWMSLLAVSTAALGLGRKRRKLDK